MSAESASLMQCWNCKTEVDARQRIGFRDHCPACDRALHACLNCDFYDPAYNNQCRETAAERVVDKDRQNFCDYFAPRRAAAPAAGNKTSSAREQLEA
ncbi:MAG TPA: hypothetical protein VMB26_16800, partial [Candidatus Binataceae bacterium]|nr:hypothetical protein [Candidatus Binataceae bacterium]